MARIVWDVIQSELPLLLKNVEQLLNEAAGIEPQPYRKSGTKEDDDDARR